MTVDCQPPSRLCWSDRLARMLTYDFCPSVNRWVYWLKKPIASLGVAAVVSLACALFVRPVAIVGFVGVALTLALGYFWPALALRRVRAELSFNLSRTSEGEAAGAVLRVTNRWPWPIFGLSLERGFVRCAQSEADADKALALDHVPGWGTTEFRFQFVPSSRGVYPFAPPLLATGFPFGLTRATRPVETAHPLLVWPKTFPLDTLLDSAESREFDDRLSDRRAGDCGDLLGTRSFRSGDSLRRVHWAQTARHGRMIVCERQGTARMSIRVIVDTDPSIHSQSHADGTLEWSLRAAASVCRVYHAQNAHVECALGSTEIVIRPGEAGLRRFLDQLAEWTPADERRAETDPVSHRSSRDEILQLHITTDEGLLRRPRLLHPRDGERCVVLRREAFENAPSERPALALCAAHSWIVLDGSRDAAEQFRRQWRRLCRNG